MLNVNAQLRRGEFAIDIAFDQSARVLGVFGPSGAGKSTMIDMIAGLAMPDSGRIELDGQPLCDGSTSVNVPPHKRRIGVMFQDDRLFPHLNVQANLLYGFRPSTSVRYLDRSMSLPVAEWEFVKLLGLGDLLSRRVTTLSGGERQRVALGRALISEPRLLLLDEPLSSLDAGLKRQILPYLRKVRDATGIPMLYVSHDLTEILRITDHLLLLDRGHVIAHGRFHEIAHQHAALDGLRDSGLVNVLAARVVSLDGGGMATLRIETTNEKRVDSPTVRVATDESRSIGESATVSVLAADVAIALGEIQGVSIQNQLRGVLTRITPHGGRVIVEVDVGVPLLAELTHRAVESLALSPGKAVWCLIKSNAIRVAD